jgi:hypothetical protein
MVAAVMASSAGGSIAPSHPPPPSDPDARAAIPPSTAAAASSSQRRRGGRNVAMTATIVAGATDHIPSSPSSSRIPPSTAAAPLPASSHATGGWSGWASAASVGPAAEQDHAGDRGDGQGDHAGDGGPDRQARGQDPAPEEDDQDKRGGPGQAPPRVATEAHQPRPMVTRKVTHAAIVAAGSPGRATAACRRRSG